MGCEERPSVFPPARRPAPSDGLQLPDVSHRAADVRSRRSPAESRGRFLRSPSEEERWEKAGEASGRFGTPASPLEGRSLFPPFPQPFRPPSRRSRRRFRICASAWDSSSTVSVCVTPIMRADLCVCSQLLLFVTTKRDIPEDPLIKGSFRASRCRTHVPQRSTTSPVDEDPRGRRRWIPVVRFLVVEFANNLELIFFFSRKGQQTKLESQK